MRNLPGENDAKPYWFTDLETYQGPVVKGWPPSQSRDMKLYLQPEMESILLGVDCFKSLVEVEVIALLQSAPENFSRRQIDRQTWMKFQDDFPGIKIVFIVGQGQDINSKALR